MIAGIMRRSPRQNRLIPGFAELQSQPAQARAARRSGRGVPSLSPQEPRTWRDRRARSEEIRERATYRSTASSLGEAGRRPGPAARGPTSFGVSDRHQVVAGAEVELAFGDRGGGHADLSHTVAGKLLELWAE